MQPSTKRLAPYLCPTQSVRVLIPDVVAKLDGPDVIWLYVRSCSSTLAHLLAIEFDAVLQT